MFVLKQKLNQRAAKGTVNTADGGDEGGFLQSYIETILGNLELKITNVHIRYEVSSTC